jgi:hypothetical protein
MQCFVRGVSVLSEQGVKLVPSHRVEVGSFNFALILSKRCKLPGVGSGRRLPLCPTPTTQLECWCISAVPEKASVCGWNKANTALHVWAGPFQS